jgi:hypothetical protein
LIVVASSLRGRHEQEAQIEGRYITLQHSLMECRAWVALSHGARSLFLALKKRLPGGNKSYISTREAARELKSSRQKVREWFAELEHYGFIAMDTPHCLGIDGVEGNALEDCRHRHD